MRQVFVLGCVCITAIANANLLPVTPYSIKLSSSFPQIKTFLGKTVGERVSDISFERGGMITELKVNDGQVVNKNDILASLDTQLLENRIQQLGAQKNGISAQLSLSQKELERLNKLRANGHISQQALDREQTNLLSLSSQKEFIDAQLESSSIEMEKSVIKAPFNGTVLQRFAHQGVTVQPGQKVMRLQESYIDEVHIGVAQEFLPILTVGKCYPIEIEKQIYQGCIEQQVQELSAKTQTVRVIFTVAARERSLSGQIAKLSLQNTVQKVGAWIPIDALAQGMRGTWVVYLLKIHDDNKKLAKISALQVDVEHIQGNSAFVSGALQDGDQIIGAGLHKYAPNQIVEVKSIQPETKGN